ncbi:MAG: thioesterase family protein [Chthoniobacterales bacterium]
MKDAIRDLPRWFNTFLWGNTVSLSWMWGLGLFFSVQFTAQYGLIGFACFAIPNALGLVLFGFVTHHIARRTGGSESLANFFTRWSRPFRLVFYLYQILAITLTLFAFIRYAWQPLHMEPDILYLPLTLLVALAAAILFGEEFNIKRVKYSHGVLFLIAVAAIATLLLNVHNYPTPSVSAHTFMPLNDWNFFGYAIPICIGFLIGPWLDLQQWQRAIQMHRERVSIAAGYLIGAIMFFCLLLFHCLMTLWALHRGAEEFIRQGLADRTYAQEVLTRYLHANATQHPYVFGAYLIFLCICILTTLDSGYIALRWFLQANVKTSNHPIFSLIPERLVTSPIPTYLFCGVIALAAVFVKLELEYFMIFYATFFVGYSLLGIMRGFMNSPANAIPQIKMFCIGSLAVVIFAYGYFLHSPIFQIIGSLLPLGYVIWILIKPGSSEEFVNDTEQLEANSTNGPVMAPIEEQSVDAPLAPSSPAPGGIASWIHPPGGHFEDKWFVHTFVATYADTNSVGNVYFGMYAMWVGKTRELFFNKVMPKFNIKETPFYILTRSFEHKFVRETREFETVTVKIKIANYNRKFVTLEHEVYDSQAHLLGKGKQSLLFVSSSDYKMLDIPSEVYSAFVLHA